MDLKKILQEARDIEEKLTSWRRHIHKYPELSFQERQTSAFISNILEKLPYKIKTGVGKTGVLAEKGEGHPCVAIRADMDALPIHEQNDVPYVSQNNGVMHACGHDAHVAIALGVATLMAQENHPGKIRFLFQPAEETGDDQNLSGAQRMIEDGAMEGVDYILALHVSSDDPLGDIVLGPGPTSAGTDDFYVTIKGTGGHAAYPHMVIDPVYISAYVITGIHTIISRRLHPGDPAVISICNLRAGEAENVIPKEVKFSGTIRYRAQEIQDKLHKELEQLLGIAKVMGGDFSLKIDKGYPAGYNNPDVTLVVRKVAEELIEASHIQDTRIGMGAEDFSYLTNISPGAMFFLGCKLDEKYPRLHHSPTFDIDERCMPTGVAILTASALRLLTNEPKN